MELLYIELLTLLDKKITIKKTHSFVRSNRRHLVTKNVKILHQAANNIYKTFATLLLIIVVTGSMPK